jgi:hypothetical protein
MLTVLLIGIEVPTDAPRATVCEDAWAVVPPTSKLGPNPSDNVAPGHSCHLLLFCNGIAYPIPPPIATLFELMPS